MHPETPAVVRNRLLSRRIRAWWPGGRESFHLATVGHPREQDAGSWRCDVSFAPDFPRLIPITGIDPEQAFVLACGLCDFLAHSLSTRGARLENLDGTPFRGVRT